MEKNKAKVKKPIFLFVALVLAVVALGCAIYFYYCIPGTSDGAADKPVDPAIRLDAQGRALARAKKYAEAVAQYSQALTIRPGDYDILMDRAQSYYNQKDFQAALTDYQFALSSHAVIDAKADPVSCATNAMLGVALCQSALDRPAMAVKTLHDLQAKDGHYIKAYQVLGDIYLKTDDTLSAIDAYTQGLRLNPDSSALHYDRSLAYTKRKMKEPAFDDLSRAIEIDNTSLQMYISHANMANKMGKPEIADGDAREILRLEPTNRSAKGWLKRRNKPLDIPAASPPPKTAESAAKEAAENKFQQADKKTAVQADLKALQKPVENAVSSHSTARPTANDTAKPTSNAAATAKKEPEKPAPKPGQKPEDKTGSADLQVGNKNSGQQVAAQAEKTTTNGAEKAKEKAADKAAEKAAEAKDKSVLDKPAAKTPDKQMQNPAARGASEPGRDPGTRSHAKQEDYFVRESARPVAPD